jgi:hypothetical protein
MKTPESISNSLLSKSDLDPSSDVDNTKLLHEALSSLSLVDKCALLVADNQSVMSTTDKESYRNAMELMGPSEIVKIQEEVKKIQNNVRGWLLRKNYINLRDATKTLQTAWRERRSKSKEGGSLLGINSGSSSDPMIIPSLMHNGNSLRSDFLDRMKADIGSGSGSGNTSKNLVFDEFASIETVVLNGGGGGDDAADLLLNFSRGVSRDNSTNSVGSDIFSSQKVPGVMVSTNSSGGRPGMVKFNTVDSREKKRNPFDNSTTINDEAMMLSNTRENSVTRIGDAVRQNSRMMSIETFRENSLTLEGEELYGTRLVHDEGNNHGEEGRDHHDDGLVDGSTAEGIAEMSSREEQERSAALKLQSLFKRKISKSQNTPYRNAMKAWHASIIIQRGLKRWYSNSKVSVQGSEPSSSFSSPNPRSFPSNFRPTTSFISLPPRDPNSSASSSSSSNSSFPNPPLSAEQHSMSMDSVFNRLDSTQSEVMDEILNITDLNTYK